MTPATGAFALSALIGPIGYPEIIIILVIVLILFGPKKLPELSRAVGRSIRDFKKGLSEIREDFDKAGEDDEDESPTKQTAERSAQAPPKQAEATEKSESADSAAKG